MLVCRQTQGQIWGSAVFCWKFSSSTFSSACMSSPFILGESSEKTALWHNLLHQQHVQPAPPSCCSSSINKTTHRTPYHAGSRKERWQALWKHSLCFCLCPLHRLPCSCCSPGSQPIQNQVLSILEGLLGCILTDRLSSAAPLPLSAGSQLPFGVQPEAIHLLQAGGAGHNDGRRRSCHCQDLPDPKHITSQSTP